LASGIKPSFSLSFSLSSFFLLGIHVKHKRTLHLNKIINLKKFSNFFFIFLHFQTAFRFRKHFLACLKDIKSRAAQTHQQTKEISERIHSSFMSDSAGGCPD
jgi:hypothetical protein